MDPTLVTPGAFVLLSGTRGVSLLLDERGSNPDAIVAANDESARGALESLLRRGVVVPDDVAVVGFDDIADAELCRPKLTTVAQPLVEAGVQTVLQLRRLLEGDELPPRLTLGTHLVCRDSCGGRSQLPACPRVGSLEESSPARTWVDRHFSSLWPWLRQ